MAVWKYAWAFFAAMTVAQLAPALEPTAPPEVVVKGVRDPSDWFRIESQHVIVYSNSNTEEAIELVNSLERLDFLLRLYLRPFLVGQAAAPKPTLYFQHRRSWPAELDEGRPSGAAGLVNICSAGAQAFTFNLEPLWTLKNSELRKAESNYGLVFNFWLYAQHFLFRQTDIRGPASFVNGFGAYFSGVRFTDTHMLIGRGGGTSYGLLQRIDQGGMYRLTFDHVLGAKKIESPGEFAVQWEYLGRSYNLMHYMLSSEQNREKMARYLQLVNDGSLAADAFADVYGLSGGALERAMKSHRLGSMKVLQVEVPELPKAEMTFSRLSRVEARFLLANAMLKACPGAARGRQLLARLQVEAAGFPAVDLAQLSLSRAQIDWGDPRDALAYLERAATRQGDRVEPHYLLGLGRLKLAERAADPERASWQAAARASLLHAASIEPGSPEVSYALFRLELANPSEPSQTGIARAIVAWRHGRDVPAFARSAALAYAWMGDAAGAYRVFNTLARNQWDEPNAAWARGWLARLESGVPREELVRAMRREVEIDPVFKLWTISSD